jgi:hypothetical protein
MQWEKVIKQAYIIGVTAIAGCLYYYFHPLAGWLFMFYLLLNNQINIISELLRIKKNTGEIGELWTSIFTTRKRF